MEKNVRIPNGLIPELKQWVEDELEQALTDTAYRRDLSIFYDRLEAAGPEIQ
ncbi:hypothetical protein [Mesobacterium pallidum]|uniref:hypothetical protein n=1 Tax=Mesobacterium pallidum TaxID=2872037 RepID=UPI001EE18DAA|nr:hypothetical protein [Mesobacterium pallidum]